MAPIAVDDADHPAKSYYGVTSYPCHDGVENRGRYEEESEGIHDTSADNAAEHNDPEEYPMWKRKGGCGGCRLKRQSRHSEETPEDDRTAAIMKTMQEMRRTPDIVMDTWFCQEAFVWLLSCLVLICSAIRYASMRPEGSATPLPAISKPVP